MSGLKAIEKWPRYIRMAEEFAPKVGPDRYLEIRYENLVADTEKQMRQVLEFVGEPWDDAVLHHTDAPPRRDGALRLVHRQAPLAAAARAPSTGPASAVVARPTTR